MTLFSVTQAGKVQIPAVWGYNSPALVAGAKTGRVIDAQAVWRVGRVVECTGLGARSMCACEANLPPGKLSAESAAGAKTGGLVAQEYGELAERLNAPVLKTGRASRSS